MDHIDIRAPGASIRAWRKLAERSEMTLSEWIRRVLDEHRNVYITTVETNSEKGKDNP
jgi:hypothetical protein